MIPQNTPLDVNIEHSDFSLLSFSQESLWLMSQFENIGAAYHITHAYHFQGQLNKYMLEKSLNEIVARHEALRARFINNDGKLYQQVLERSPIELSEVFVGSVSQENGAMKLHKLLSQEAQIPFDLETSPLLRAKLYVLGEKKHCLQITIHHIVFDAWSFTIFLDELATLYNAYVNGEMPSTLPTLPIQYPDFVRWERKQLQEKALQVNLDFWRRKLANVSSPLLLPTDKPRPASQTFEGKTYTFSLPQKLVDHVKTLSRKERVTPFTIYLSAFKVLLYKYTGQSDIVVGTAVTNRRQIELESLIGLFVDTLPLLTHVAGTLTFQDLLLQVQETTLDGYQYAMPFARLVRSLHYKRDQSHNPFFQTMFSYRHEENISIKFSNLFLKQVPVERQSAQFDLNLLFTESPKGITGSLEYNTCLFTEPTVERMMKHLTKILHGVVARADMQIDDLPLLTDFEWQQAIIDWNATQTVSSIGKCVHELFEEQARQTPSATALVFGNRSLCYQELNEHANQVAHYLIKQGVEPEDLVAICMERSIRMVVSILGILKSGGAYIPLDPTYPQERLNYILEDTKASVIILDGHSQEMLHAQQYATLRVSDLHWDEIEREATTNPSVSVSSHNLAYVIYTSGSTGLPKGVQIEHRNAVALLSWAANIYTWEEIQGLLASTSICFDLSIYELFLPLSQGGTIILVESLLHLITQPTSRPITLINTVPSLMNELIQIGEIPKSVLTINLAGELLTRDLVQRIYNQSTVQRVYNLYGPSEDTVYSTYALIKRQLSSKPSIGMPIDNTQCYILNSRLHPVPIGVVGELYLAGAGLARGYIAQPEVTSNRFVSNPYSDEFGKRMYKTGDLVRRLPDGNIEFVGRIDNQIKLRGFRIELGEIESVLNTYESVNTNTVLVREDRNKKSILTAYIVPSSSEFSIEEVKSFLGRKLPTYMLPTVYIIMKAFPLKPNGKIDARALPMPTVNRSEQRTGIVEPRSVFELQLKHIWKECLGLDTVSMHDNFFELGGDSFVAIRLIGKIQQLIGDKVSLATLFQAPTIEKLAQTFSQRNVVRRTPLAPLQPRGNKKSVFMIHPLGGDVFCYMPLAQKLSHYDSDIPVWGIRAKGIELGCKPDVTIEEMSTRYADLIQSIDPVGPYYIAGWSFGGIVAYDVACQLWLKGIRNIKLLVIDTRLPTQIQIPSDLLDELKALINYVQIQGGEIDFDVLSKLRHEEQFLYLIKVGRKTGKQGSDFDLDLVRRHGNTRRANAQALSNYFPPKYKGEMLLIRRDSLDNSDFTWSWDSVVTGHLTVQTIPCLTHSDIVKDARLAEVIVDTVNQGLISEDFA